MAQPKVFLITGAASGIGAALARLAVESGHTVVLADINLAGARGVAGEIGREAIALHLDIRSSARWDAVLDKVWKRFGRLDVLVNNAAIVHTGYARDLPMELHEDTLATNFLGPVKGMMAALPRFRAQGSGHLVTICSMTAFLPFPGIASYAAAKHALRAFHLGLALEERDGPVKFTIVHPTATETPMLNKEAEDDALAVAFAGKSVTPEFVAAVVLNAIGKSKIEAFAPPERGSAVKRLGASPSSLWKAMAVNAVVGAKNLRARREAKAK